MNQKVKLLVGMTTVGPTFETFTSWNSFWTDLIRAAEFEVGCKFVYRKAPFVAHEELAKYAVDTEATHILFIDDDIYDYSLLDLVKLLEADVDMIGGVMLTRRFPFHVCAMRRLDNNKPLIEHCKNVTGFDMYEVPIADRKGVKPVDLLSFGFTLVKTDLLKKIKPPYFIPKPSKIEESKLNNEYLSFTDSIFCDRVFNTKSQPYAHFDVWLNHNGITKDNVGAHMEIYRLTGKLTQPGIKMNNKELLEYKMKVKELMTDAEMRFHSEAVDKLKFYKPVEEKKEVR
jgi:hypothetical protein